jgi:AraC-like DNA-binding protein
MGQLNIVSLALLSFFFVSFISKKGKTLPEKILLFWLGMLIFTQVAYLIERSEHAHRFHFVVEHACNLNIIHGATLLAYVKSHIYKGYTLKLAEAFHLTPLILLVGAKFIMQDVLELYSCETEGSCTCANNIYQRLIIWYKLLIVGGYIAYTLSVYLKSRKTEAYLLRLTTQTKWWITSVVFGSVMLLMLIVALELVQTLSIYYITDKLLVINILTSIFAILFVYIGNRYSFLLSKVGSSTEKSRTQNTPIQPVQDDESLIDPRLERIFTEVTLLMKEKQRFLEPDLSLSMVSVELNTPSVLVSQAIKVYANQSFPSYINTFRVNMVIEKMNSPLFKTYTLLSLALESGFNSKASFNRIFKQQMSVTPSEYAAQLGLSQREE